MFKQLGKTLRLKKNKADSKPGKEYVQEEEGIKNS